MWPVVNNNIVSIMFLPNLSWMITTWDIRTCASERPIESGYLCFPYYSTGNQVLCNN